MGCRRATDRRRTLDRRRTGGRRRSTGRRRVTGRWICRRRFRRSYGPRIRWVRVRRRGLWIRCSVSRERPRRRLPRRPRGRPTHLRQPVLRRNPVRRNRSRARRRPGSTNHAVSPSRRPPRNGRRRSRPRVGSRLGGCRIRYRSRSLRERRSRHLVGGRLRGCLKRRPRTSGRDRNLGRRRRMLWIGLRSTPVGRRRLHRRPTSTGLRRPNPRGPGRTRAVGWQRPRPASDNQMCHKARHHRVRAGRPPVASRRSSPQLVG
jgi:hypothetical protein